MTQAQQQQQQQLLWQQQYLALVNSQSMAVQNPHNLLNTLRLQAIASPMSGSQASQAMLLPTASHNVTSLHPAAMSSASMQLSGQIPFGFQQFQQPNVFTPFTSASQANSGLQGMTAG